MPDQILKPESGGNPKAAQTRIGTRSTTAVGGQRAHDLRIGPQPAYVDKTRTHLNRVLIKPMTGTQLRAICEKRRASRTTARAMKSSAAVGVAGIITFGIEAQRIFEQLPPDQQDAAYRETAEAIATRLNTTLSGLVAHADESAPHAHFQTPAYDLTGHPISETAKRGAWRDLQTITAEVMARHAPGIERGRSKIDRLKAGASPAEVVNRSVAQLHDELPAEIAAKEAELAEVRAKLATNLDRLAKARTAAEAEGQKALKAKKRAETYEIRVGNAQVELESIEAALKRLRELQAGILAESRKLSAEAAERAAKADERETALAAREKALSVREAAASAAEARLERTGQWVERGLANLSVAMAMAEDGTHGQEITPEDMADAPEKFAVLKDAAPRNRPTLGFRARFWSLNFSDGAGPAPLPENIRNGLTRAFSRVAAWAGHIAIRERKLKEQEQKAAERLERVEAEAAQLVAKAQRDAEDMAGMADALDRVRQAPESMRQLYNNLTSLREAVAETLQQLGIAGKRPDLGEQDENGEPPPVLDLVFSRADRKTNRKNEELTARLGRSGPSMR